jgi:predicted transcriptional regulator of viral defense system
MLVKNDTDISTAWELITTLAAGGRYHFTSAEARSALGVSPAAAKLAVHRLARQGLVASPARGFYVILPPEYQRLGCLPAEQFIPVLMERLRLRYYAGLLTAAQFHGAAHQRPQEFQVIIARNRRPIACGAVRVAFIARKRLDEVPVRRFNTPRGTISVSTVEATAVDLVGYEHHAGGLNQVANVLAELSGQIDPDLLAAAALSAPVPWAQRLGYLLELVGAADRVAPLKAYVSSNARNYTYLQPAGRRSNVKRSPCWKLYVNADVEIET